MDDHELDCRFGRWLSARRVSCQMTVEQVSSRSQIPPQRIRALELGYAARGVTRTEAEKLSELYKIDLSDFQKRAGGNTYSLN